jgi:hypothetical protein
MRAMMKSTPPAEIVVESAVNVAAQLAVCNNTAPLEIPSNRVFHVLRFIEFFL